MELYTKCVLYHVFLSTLHAFEIHLLPVLAACSFSLLNRIPRHRDTCLVLVTWAVGLAYCEPCYKSLVPLDNP